MSEQQITISLPQELARYVGSAPNASSLIAEALRHYQARERRRELARAYREDAEESRLLHLEWSLADAEYPD